MSTQQSKPRARYAVLLSAVSLALLAIWSLVDGFWTGLVQLLFAGLIVDGLIERRRELVWVGAISATVYGGLSIFGSGPYFFLLGLACLISTATCFRSASPRSP